MDFTGNRTVPFEIQDASYGLKEVKGLLKLREEGLELEFEVKDALLGLYSSGVKNVIIPFSDLESIEFKKGWFSARVILEGRSMKVFDGVPGTDVARCKLTFKRKYRGEAENLVSKARLAFSEYRLDRMDKEEEADS